MNTDYDSVCVCATLAILSIYLYTSKYPQALCKADKELLLLNFHLGMLSKSFIK